MYKTRGAFGPACLSLLPRLYETAKLAAMPLVQTTGDAEARAHLGGLATGAPTWVRAPT